MRNSFADCNWAEPNLDALAERYHRYLFVAQLEQMREEVVDVQWMVESYGLFLGALILVGDSLGESFGRRLMLVLGVANLLSLS